MNDYVNRFIWHMINLQSKLRAHVSKMRYRKEALTVLVESEINRQIRVAKKNKKKHFQESLTRLQSLFEHVDTICSGFVSLLLVQNKILFVDSLLRRNPDSEALMAHFTRLQKEHSTLAKLVVDEPGKMEGFLAEKLGQSKLIMIRFYPYSLYVSGVKKAASGAV